MKLIDLFPRFANGEKIKFQLDSEIYYFDGEKLFDEIYGEVDWYIDKDWLNEKVEIIEEDNKIEKFVFGEIEDQEHYNIKKKINEIIDKLEEIK